MVQFHCASCLLAAKAENIQPFGYVRFVNKVVVPVRAPDAADLAPQPIAERTAYSGDRGRIRISDFNRIGQVGEV